VRDGQTNFDPQRRYMFGYSPHGLFPIGMQLPSTVEHPACAILLNLCLTQSEGVWDLFPSSKTRTCTMQVWGICH
jgi:hypothetical protein